MRNILTTFGAVLTVVLVARGARGDEPPAPTPPPGESSPGGASEPLEKAAGGVKKSLEEQHEKTGEAVKDAAGATKEAAEGAAEAAKEAVEHPAEAAKEAAEAAAEKGKEVILSFGEDMRRFPRRLWVDVRELPSLRTAIVLGGGSIASYYSSEHWDDKVRRNIANDPERFGRAENNTLDKVAHPYTLFGVSSAVYGTSLIFESDRLHEFSLDMMSAMTIEMPVVFVLKKAFHTRRPNGDPEGFPSGHTAGAVTLATLLGEHFGLYPGIGGYVFAGFVAFHRLDFGKHDLSDVLFGAALGYAVGRTAGDTEELPLIQAHLVPFPGVPETSRVPFGGSLATPPGIGLEWRF